MSKGGDLAFMGRRPRRSGLSAAAAAVGCAAAVAVVGVVVEVPAAAAGRAAAQHDLTDYIKAKQQATVTLAAAAREALIGDRRCKLLATCAPSSTANCSVEACGWSFGPDFLTCESQKAN